MAMTKGEIRSWLDSISDDDEELISIDDGGLTLVCVNAPSIYIEVGGIPEDAHVCGDECRSNGCRYRIEVGEVVSERYVPSLATVIGKRR